MRFLTLVTCVLFLFQIGVHAQEDERIDSASQDALVKTQALLHDSKERGETIRGSERAQQADAYAGQIGKNAAGKEAIYGLSAEAMKSIVEKNHGDPEAMSKVLQDAGRDPASFLQSLGPDMQNKVSNLAKQLDDGAANPGALK